MKIYTCYDNLAAQQWYYTNDKWKDKVGSYDIFGYLGMNQTETACLIGFCQTATCRISALLKSTSVRITTRLNDKYS